MPRKVKNSKPKKSQGESAESANGTVAGGTKKPSSAAPIKDRSQSLEFIDVTRQYSDGVHDVQQQKFIRAHVMQEFLRHKSKPEKSPVPSQMKDTVQSHVTRFRYSPRTALQKNALPSLTHHRKIAMNTQSKPAIYTHPPFQTGSTQLSTEAMVIWMTPQTDEYHIESADAATQPGPWVRTSLLGDRDPFAQLPIEASDEAHKMLHYYHTAFWTNSLGNNPAGNYLSFTATDPAMFHATLSLVSQHEALRRRTPASRAFYFHRGEAIRFVTARIGDAVQAISDATIGAVAVLSITDNEASVPSNVQSSHNNGLASLVKMRGGLESLRSNEVVTRTVVWADLFHAASHATKATMTRPAKSDIEESEEVQHLLINRNLDETTKVAPQYGMYVPPPLVRVFDKLHALCAGRSSPDIFHIENIRKRKAFSDLLARVEYFLLVDHNTTTSPQLFLNDQQMIKVDPNPNDNEQTEAIYNATVSAALIFSYWNLREIPISAQPFGYLVRRLRGSLQEVIGSHTNHDQDSITTTYILSPTPSPHLLLLWLCFQGFKTASLVDSRASDCRWFVNHATDLCSSGQAKLAIDSEEELELAIREILYLKESDGDFLTGFWRAISGILPRRT